MKNSDQKKDSFYRGGVQIGNYHFLFQLCLSVLKFNKSLWEFNNGED